MMSPSKIVISIVFIASLQCVGAGNNGDGEISATDLKNIMVSLSSQKKMDFICLAVFIRWNWILLTTYCDEELSPFKDEMFMKYGLNVRKDPIPEYMNIVGIKKVDILSKFSVMFLNCSNPLTSYLKLGHVESHSTKDKWFDGKMTGWSEGQKSPEIVDVKIKFYPNIQLDKAMSTYNILDFPYGSVITMGREIIAFRGNKAFLNQITFADKLIVDEMLELQEKSDREGRSGIGYYDDGRIRKIDFYTIMVSFWKSRKAPEPSELICLGVLIRSNIIFLTALCAKKLEPLGEIVVKSGGYAVHNSSPQKMEIISRAKLRSHSMFSIVFLRSPIPLSSSLILDHVQPPSDNYDLFDGTLVGWNQKKNRPEPVDAKIIANRVRISLERTPGTYLRSIIHEGSILVKDGKIIALADRPGQGTLSFIGISPVDKSKMQEILNIQNNVVETSRAGQIESGETSGMNLNNIMASFWKNQEEAEKLQLIGLGVFIRSNWILVTRTCAEQLNPLDDIVIKSGDKNVQNTLSQTAQIEKMRNVYLNSNFRIVQLKCSVRLLSSPDIEYFHVPPEESFVYEGTLVEWDEQNTCPRTAIRQITIRSQLTVNQKTRMYPKTIFPDGTAVLWGSKIIGLASNVRADLKGVTFFKVGLDDKLRIEGELEAEDESYREEEVKVSEEDYESLIAIFRKTNADGYEEIVCLGAFIIKKWVLVTKQCLEMVIQYSVTTAEIGKNSPKLNIAGKQRLSRSSYFILVVLGSETVVTSSVKLFYQSPHKYGSVDEKLFGWNSQGVMTDDIVYSTNNCNSRNAQRFQKNGEVTFPSGSMIVWRKDKITALSYVDKRKTKFRTITFEDYHIIHALILGTRSPATVPLNEVDPKPCKRLKKTLP